MSTAAPVAVLAVVFVALLALMHRGWRRRARRHGDLPVPAPLDLPADVPGAAGVYVATTLAGQPLERVTAHGLGSRSRVRLVHGDGEHSESWGVLRPGAASFTIPGPDVVAVTTAPGMVGKWIGGDGLLVIRWQLGDTLLDTGFRLDRRADHDRLLARGAQEPTHPPSTAPLPKEPS